MKYKLFACVKCLILRVGPANVVGSQHFCPVCKSTQTKFDLDIILEGENFIELIAKDRTFKEEAKKE